MRFVAIFRNLMHLYFSQGHLLCRMNDLPASTLRTTPHLLHTRTVLRLPPSARLPPPSAPLDPTANAERAARISRERAAKRLQTVTKETDWRIAKAYVALAGDADDDVAQSKENVSKKAPLPSSMDSRAVDQYLDDEEWEAQERREGRSVHIPRFPFAQLGTQKGKSSEASSSRWSWRR
jgi:hypothetical protein